MSGGEIQYWTTIMDREITQVTFGAKPTDDYAGGVEVVAGNYPPELYYVSPLPAALEMSLRVPGRPILFDVPEVAGYIDLPSWSPLTAEIDASRAIEVYGLSVVRTGDTCVFTPEAGATSGLIRLVAFGTLTLEYRVRFPDIVALRYGLKAEVDRLVEFHLYKPCLGFDADQIARGRITGMILRLERGSGLPPTWSGWMDASGTIQWALDGPSDVLANLIVLSVAIEDRESTTLANSWAHKAAIDLLITEPGVVAYDVSTGWPA